jgi:hypothetical protein
VIRASESTKLCLFHLASSAYTCCYTDLYLFQILRNSILLCEFFFFKLHSTTQTLMTYVHSHLRTHTRKTLFLWAPSKDWTDRSQNLQSHHERIAVDEDVAYHWKYNTVKVWNNIRKYEHSCQVKDLNPSGTTKNPANWSFSVRQ